MCGKPLSFAHGIRHRASQDGLGAPYSPRRHRWTVQPPDALLLPPPLVIAFHRPVEDSATGREVWERFLSTEVHRAFPRERADQWPRNYPKCFGNWIFVIGGRADAPRGAALPGGAPGALAKGVVHLISCASPCFCAAGHLQKHALHR